MSLHTKNKVIYSKVPLRQVNAMTIGHLNAIIWSMEDSPTALRDKAILLVGYYGALRRSEISGICANHLIYNGNQLTVFIPKSKTDKAGRGQTVTINTGTGMLCPIAALSAWIDFCFGNTPPENKPIFRPIDRHGNIGGSAITDRSIARIIKNRIVAIGGNPANFSGHSLRVGFVTDSINQGRHPYDVVRQTRHESMNSLFMYYRSKKPLIEQRNT